MAYVRVYENRIEWENYPSVNTPLDEINLNKMDYALNQIDGTLETWDTTKADESDMLLAVKTIEFNDENGQITITFFNGTTTVIDTLLEKVAVNFDYDDDPTSAHYQSLIITLDDGTVKYVDLSALITQYEFIDSSTMHFTVNQDGEITVDIIDGSITEAKLRPQFLADCIAAKNAAQSAQVGAETAETDAEESAEDSEAWAVGQRNGQDVPPSDPTYHNNAKYWAGQSGTSTLSSMADVEIVNPVTGQTLVYNSTSAKWENAAGGGSAGNVSYDNASSGLTATNVQDAIDEVVTDVENLSTEVDDKHTSTMLAVSLTGWTTDTTSQSGTTLYKKQISLTHVYVANPSVDIGAGTGYVLPTSAEQESYNLIQYVTVDDTVPCLYLYASEIPTTAFYIKVTGVE